MRRTIILFLLIGLFAGRINPAHAALPVIDAASLAQLANEVKNTLKMIDELQRQYLTMKDQYEMLKRYGEIDHDGLANIKFGTFLNEFKSRFDEITKAIDGYQNGGLLGQISRLDEIYKPYHNDWEEMDKPGDFTYEADPNTRDLKKQILWTKIQLKHAAIVASTIRENLPKSEDQINTLLDDTNQAQGMLLTAQIGNQLMGTVGKSLNTLNVQLTEMVQSQVAQGLENNQREGHRLNRAREAIEDWGKPRLREPPAPLNPIGAK